MLHDRFSLYRTSNTKAFTVVSPGKNEVMIADVDAVIEVVGKYKKWHRPQELYTVFATFGENVNTSQSEVWQRHRKIINYGFREHNNTLVWESAMKQAKQWMDAWESRTHERSMRTLEDDMDTISTNVLMFAAFGQDYNFTEGGLKDVPQGHTKSFAEVMISIYRNTFLAWATRDLYLPRMIEPKKLTQLRATKQELFQYYDESLRRGDGDFVKSFLEANENEKKGGRQYLTRDELFGNMYIIQLGGFDTTSYTMLFTLALLATHPAIQVWMTETIGEYEEYEDDYPTAIRCQAAMHETLRVYGAAPSLARHSPNVEAINIAGKEVIIPAKTYVSANFAGCQHDPDIWGDDAAEWKPQRWIETVDGKEQFNKSLDLLAWSAGPRICPGKKFSQVEFTAVMSTLLKRHRVEASPGLQAALDDFDFEITPRIKRSRIDSLSVKFIER